MVRVNDDRFLRGRVVREYSLNHPIAGMKQIIKLPFLSQVLYADEQDGEVIIAVLHHKEAIHMKNYHFHILATGWDIECEAELQLKYINTVHVRNEWGTTPWHVFVEE